MEEQPTKKARSLISFWAHGFNKARKKSWDHYGNWLIGLALLYTIAIVLLHKKHPTWLQAEWKGFDVSTWMQLLIPAAVLVIVITWHLFRAPYEIYKEQFEKHQEDVERLEKAIGTKLDKEKRARILHDGIFKLENRIRELNGAKRYFQPSGEDKREAVAIVDAIYNDLFDSFGADVAGLYAASKSTTKPQIRFGAMSEHDREWIPFLDYLDAHIESLKTIIAKQM